MPLVDGAQADMGIRLFTVPTTTVPGRSIELLDPATAATLIQRGPPNFRALFQENGPNRSTKPDRRPLLLLFSHDLAKWEKVVSLHSASATLRLLDQ